MTMLAKQHADMRLSPRRCPGRPTRGGAPGRMDSGSEMIARTPRDDCCQSRCPHHLHRTRHPVLENPFAESFNRSASRVRDLAGGGREHERPGNAVSEKPTSAAAASISASLAPRASSTTPAGLPPDGSALNAV